MLRIALTPKMGGAGPTPMAQPAIAIDPDAQDQDQDQDIDQSQGGDDDTSKVDQTIAGYMGPESGPFMCGNCVHFDGQNACNIVSGDIDSAGCCDIYKPQANGPKDQNPPLDAGEETPDAGSDNSGQ